MTRKKVKLAFIVNDSARKATYKKRKKGLLKKVDELSTLCGIEACAVVYSPYDPEPEVWPSTPWGVQRVLSKFRNMPELEQSKKMVNQETFLKQRILKAKEQVKKIRKENREKEMTQLMFQYLSVGKIIHSNISVVDLNDLAWLIDQNLKDIGRRLETLNKEDHQNMNQGQGQGQTTTKPTLPLELLRVAKSEEMSLMDHFHGNNNGLEMNNVASASDPASTTVVAENVPKNWFMDLINGNGDENTMSFGDANLQNGFWPNPLLP